MCAICTMPLSVRVSGALQAQDVYQLIDTRLMAKLQSDPSAYVNAPLLTGMPPTWAICTPRVSRSAPGPAALGLLHPEQTTGGRFISITY